MPRVDTPARVLEAEDFAAFRGLADLPLGMTAHIVYSAFDAETPATCSPAMIRLIRETIGFSGLLMTDDIAMEALAGTPSERGRAALEAGCDLVLHCNGAWGEMQALAADLPPMTAGAEARAAAALAARRCPAPVDIAALEAELDGLLTGGAHGRDHR